MRIGIFTETYTPYISGLVTSELMLKNALEEKGHEVYVVTANLQNFHYDYDEKEKVLRIPGIPTGIYDSRLTSIYPIQAVNKIKSWNLDIIHSQTEFAIGTFARIFAKQYNIPIVHTYHTMYEDYVHYITKGHFNKSSKKLVEYLTKFYCDKTITELIVPTKKAYDLFKEKYNVERNIHIVPTGIEVERFYKENMNQKRKNEIMKQYKLNKKDFIGVFVGRIAEEKNIPFLINVTEKIIKEKPQMKLLIVGDGPDKEKYEKLVKEKKCEKNIIFTGKVPWEDIPIYYHVGNVFLSASTTETQGLTIIEAMAASLPTICINDESFRNTIVDDLNGYLFDTEEECQKCITKVIENKKLEQSLKRGAKASAEKHSSKYFASHVLDVYNKAIETQKNSLKSKFINLVSKVNPWKK